jgi:hypothetical protein
MSKLEGGMNVKKCRRKWKEKTNQRRKTEICKYAVYKAAACTMKHVPLQHEFHTAPTVMYCTLSSLALWVLSTTLHSEANTTFWELDLSPSDGGWMTRHQISGMFSATGPFRTETLRFSNLHVLFPNAIRPTDHNSNNLTWHSPFES